MVVVGAMVILTVFEFVRFPFLRATALSVLAVQSLLLMWVAGGVVRFNLELSQSGLHPARILVLTFVALIVAGAVLLSLPRAMAPEHRHAEGP